MMVGIRIEQAPNHALILRTMLLCLALEELDAAFAQGDRDLDSLIPEDKIFRGRKEVRNDLWVAEWFVRVPDSLAHRFAFPFANILPRRFELHRPDT